MFACPAETPASPVLYVTQSLQLAAVVAKVNFAGYWPVPTVAPVPISMLQSVFKSGSRPWFVPGSGRCHSLRRSCSIW